MSTQNKELVRRWFEQVWNNGRADAIDELLSVQSIARGLGQDLHGPAAFKQFQAAYRDAFPDIAIQIEDIIAEDDLVAVRWTATATHGGGGLGYAATGNPVTFSGMAFVRVEDNKLVEGWNNFDQLGLLKQIGVVTA